jgi:MATE family multidrug resistance protein
MSLLKLAPMPDAPRSALAELLYLALPTVAQMASYTVMQFIDTWILSRLGDTAATAASNSGILTFALVAFGLGTLVLVNTLVSQSFGRGEFKQCGQFLWQGIWFGLFYGLALIPLRAGAGPLFSLFHHPAEQAQMETIYCRIVLLSAGIKLISTSIGQFCLGIDRPNAVLASAAFGVSINAITAWCIVLGRFGFQPHGVAGAAWAQNVGVTCELLMLAILVLRKSIREKFNVLDIRPRPHRLATLLRVGIPSGGQWFSDICAWGIFCNGVMGILGPAAMAANTFMLRYMTVSFMPAFGLSAAVTALVGRYIGRGRPDLARNRAHLGMIVGLVYVFACGLVYIFARRPLMELFSVDPQVIRVGQTYLIFAAIYEISDALYILYSGALRGAGDTLIPTLATGGLCWSMVVLGGFLVARAEPNWNTGPWIVACVYGWILGFWMMWRFVRGRWEKIQLR